MVESRRGNRDDTLESPTNRNKKPMIRRRNKVKRFPPHPMSWSF